MREEEEEVLYNIEFLLNPMTNISIVQKKYSRGLEEFANERNLTEILPIISGEHYDKIQVTLTVITCYILGQLRHKPVWVFVP